MAVVGGNGMEMKDGGGGQGLTLFHLSYQPETKGAYVEARSGGVCGPYGGWTERYPRMSMTPDQPPPPRYRRARGFSTPSTCPTLNRPPESAHVYDSMSIHPAGKTCSDLGSSACSQCPYRQGYSSQSGLFYSQSGQY